MEFRIKCVSAESFAPERQNEMDWVAKEDEQFQHYLTIHRQLSTILADHEAERIMFPHRPKYLSSIDDSNLYHITPTFSVKQTDQYQHNSSTPYVEFDPFFLLPYSKHDLIDGEAAHFYAEMQPRKCIVCTSVDHLIYCYGGNRSNTLADLWCYNTENQLWHRVSGVYSCFHVRSEELYYLHLNAMGQRTTLQELNYPRSQIAVTLLSTTDVGVHWRQAELIMYGGWTGNLAVNELWAFSCRQKKWRRINALYGDTLPSRYDHAARFVNQRYMVVFGGFSHDFALNSITLGDTQIYDIQTNSWLVLDQSQLGTQQPPPSGGLVHCAHQNKLFVAMGGTNDISTFNSIYYFDIQIMKWNKVEAYNPMPAPRYMLSGQILEGNLIFIGGKLDGHCVNEIWTFNLEDHLWTNRSELMFQELGNDSRKSFVNMNGNSIQITPETVHEFHQFRQQITSQELAALSIKASSRFLSSEEKQSLFQMLYQLLPMARVNHHSCKVHPSNEVYFCGGLTQLKVSLGDVWKVKVLTSSLPSKLHKFDFFADVVFEYGILQHKQ